MNAAIEFRNITKRFPGAVALEDVTVEIAAGTCHALCGENGAGKSTLGKVLAGIVPPDEGVAVARRHARSILEANPGASGGRRDGAPGACVLRKPVRRREPDARSRARPRRVRFPVAHARSGARDARGDRARTSTWIGSSAT